MNESSGIYSISHQIRTFKKVDKTDLSSIHQMEVREEQLEDENEQSMDDILPQTLSIQNDARLSTFNGQG